MRYVLVIDVGNSNIVIGAMSGGRVMDAMRMDTHPEASLKEIKASLGNILDAFRAAYGECEGGIVASVVPQLTPKICTSVRQLTGVELLKMGDATVNIGLQLHVEHPERLGHDRIADAVGAKAKYAYPLMIVDMGTATTINVVDEEGRFAGGMIIPGMKTSFDALCHHAAQLREVPLKAPEHLIGRNTTECMQSGMVYGYASMIDGLIDRVSLELKAIPRVILTGGLASLIVSHCKHQVIADEYLLLHGLFHIYTNNVEPRNQSLLAKRNLKSRG
ncbi:MAG: type III pantothenate kinase [Prevotella sp.]|nr:type III pantothenate kinase [Prevotella sp.]